VDTEQPGVAPVGQPEQEKDQGKGLPIPQYVSKDKPKRPLLKNSPKGGASSMNDRLRKLANEFDRRGLDHLADKIDIILQGIDKNV
jgi:hypothetical protein